jgi:hypothetical protein
VVNAVKILSLELEGGMQSACPLHPAPPVLVQRSRLAHCFSRSLMQVRKSMQRSPQRRSRPLRHVRRYTGMIGVLLSRQPFDGASRCVAPLAAARQDEQK